MKHIGSSAFQTMVVSCQDFYPGIHWIKTRDFMDRPDRSKWIIVDVRTEVERSVSVIPASVSMRAFRERIEHYEGQPVLVYCTVGCRSAGAAQSLQEIGVEVYNLWGGVIDWAREGGDFCTLSGQPTKSVHTHGKRWNLLPSGYKAVW
jgi:rhodanese-related sulfurtransferase